MTGAAWWWSWLLAALSLVALWLVGSKNRAGWWVGLGAQMLWAVYGLMSGQPGFIVSAAAFSVVNVRALRKWRRAAHGEER